MTDTPENIWVVRVQHNSLSTYHYAAVNTEDDARSLVSAKNSGAKITGAKSVANVDKIKKGKVIQVPEGDYSGPLIP